MAQEPWRRLTAGIPQARRSGPASSHAACHTQYCCICSLWPPGLPPRQDFLLVQPEEQHFLPSTLEFPEASWGQGLPLSGCSAYRLWAYPPAADPHSSGWRL